MIFSISFLMNIISGIVLVFQKKEKTIHHTMVSFDGIRFAKKTPFTGVTLPLFT